MNNPTLRFRQVHLDFHTAADIPDVGSDFDAEKFADTLVKANVNSITCFARCHHGMMYYDSKLNPERVHPNLKNVNILKEQIAACHRRGIRVPIYTTVQWDQYTANEHPEWMAEDINGGFISWQTTYEPGFYRTICLNSPYREFLKAHTREILEELRPVDGLFFDILFLNECSCKYCRAKMEGRGYNPAKKNDRLKYAREMLDGFMLEMTDFVRQYDKDCTVFYNMSHVGPALRGANEAFTHYEMESLPSGGWGYMHFPVTARYARTLGRDCLGMTGKFHTEWGDFHSYKNRAALEFECFRMLALNAKCMIGDQMEPCGVLSKPVYDLIGPVYAQVRQKEPWCAGAIPVNDIGVFTPEEFAGSGLNPSIRGVSRMLAEGGHQFDIVDTRSDISPYKVLILPDRIPVSPELAERLQAHLAKGGAVIGSMESGLNSEQTEFAFTGFGVRMKEEMTRDEEGDLVRGREYPRFAYADYLLPKGVIARGLAETEYAMYMKGLEVEALEGAEVLADVVLPYYNRTWKHYCSHRQAPCSGKVGYAGIVKNGNAIYFAHPIFSQYDSKAPLWCKRLFLNALDMLLPDPVLRHSGPSTVLATVNRQEAENRLVVHLLHYIPERRSDIDIIEDVIPIYKVNVSISAAGKVKRMYLAPEGTELAWEITDGRIAFTVPEVKGHQMVAIEFCEV